MRRAAEVQEEWKPRTKLGMLVTSGQITSMEEVFALGYRIQEPEITQRLLPDIKTEVIHVGIVQKQTDAGEMTRFKAIVACGDESGFIGIGDGKARQMRTAIEKATKESLMNVIPVRLGCGSWECRCTNKHSIPYRVYGRGGSVKVELIPAPRGLGIVAGDNIKVMLRLAGIKDVWTKTFGSTSTMSSTSKAVYEALRNTYRIG
ncbi:MAG: 30S ribosomal protein S5 [Candidatus Nitrosothermus koennekii]|nr:MAG: 30S ribosomal protein S5 [Candidatus Nitrosothermus koennekii]